MLYELSVSLCDQGLALLDDKTRLKQLDKTKALAAGGWVCITTPPQAEDMAQEHLQTRWEAVIGMGEGR